MILNKQNLMVLEILGTGDKKIPVLDNIHVMNDGTTVARNSKAMILVSPVSDEIKDKLKDIIPNSPGFDVTISRETIKEVLSSLPRDIKFKGMLEHVDIQNMDEKVCFSLTDGKREQTLTGRKFNRPYINFKIPLKEAYLGVSGVETTQGKGNVVLDANKLLLLLNTIKKMVSTSNDLPVFISFTENNDVLIRAMNPKTGQRIVGLMTSYQGIEGKWLEMNDWEKSLIDIKTPIKKYIFRRNK